MATRVPNNDETFRCAECKEEDVGEEALLVIHPDRSMLLACGGCLAANPTCLRQGSLVFRIGDDVTGQFS
jgi:hypothetical protein